MKRLVTGIAIVIFFQIAAKAAMNPISNPASNIYNPASRMDNPDPLSPPTQPVPQQKTTEVEPVAQPIPPVPPAQEIKEQPQPLAKPRIPQKRYSFKTVQEYLNAAKKSFAREDYGEFLFITEDALRRINAGTLKASRKTKQKLVTYKKIGSGLLNQKTTQELQEP
ncbi:MAG: hypothetical protein HXX11_05565 [Desulfuromonadales bacterium]|nr:hypothetical protein [Desulfuromonadales bacterium]